MESTRNPTGRRTHLGSRIQLKGKKPNSRKIAAKKSAAENIAKAGGRATLAPIKKLPKIPPNRPLEHSPHSIISDCSVSTSQNYPFSPATPFSPLFEPLIFSSLHINPKANS